ncbi:hypothetical protein A2U01_0036446, partial [Trifolium medium]|nr:hypothetical protein [Trifolium medium]
MVNKEDGYGRYGHLSLKGLDALSKRKMVKGLPKMKDNHELCSDYVVSKQHRDIIALNLLKVSKAPLYDPVQEEIFISRDVASDESQGWNWGEKNKTQIVQSHEVADSEPAVEADQGVTIEDITEEEAIQNEVIFDETKGWEWNGKIQQRQDC